MTTKYDALEELAKKAKESLELVSTVKPIRDYLGAASPEKVLDLIADVRALAEALTGYMSAVALMNAAMQDGINVQGALSGLSAREEMAIDALKRIQGEGK